MLSGEEWFYREWKGWVLSGEVWFTGRERGGCYRERERCDRERKRWDVIESGRGVIL